MDLCTNNWIKIDPGFKYFLLGPREDGHVGLHMESHRSVLLCTSEVHAVLLDSPDVIELLSTLTRIIRLQSPLKWICNVSCLVISNTLNFIPYGSIPGGVCSYEFPSTVSLLPVREHPNWILPVVKWYCNFLVTDFKYSLLKTWIANVLYNILRHLLHWMSVRQNTAAGLF